MSERYTRVFSLPDSLYAETSPIIIAAGALLKDNQTGKMLVQMKLRSIAASQIKAVKVIIQPKDILNCDLGNKVTYTYLDLSTLRDEEFGQKTLIPMPSSETRGYDVRVSEVIFEDNKVWACDTDFEPVIKPATLKELLISEELIKQYKIKYGSDCVVEPTEYKDLWYCACGELNRKGESCRKCGLTLDFLTSFDIQELTTEKDARLAHEAELAAKAAAEEAKRKAEAAERAKKNKKIISIVAPIVVALIAAFFVVTKVVIPNGKYSDAEALFAAEKYDEAIAAFEALGDYKDSASRIDEVKTAKADAAKRAEEERIEAEKAAAYAEAEKLAANGEKAKAAIAFGKLSGYKDARERSFDLWDAITARDTISAGGYHTVSLKSDGTVVAVGYNKYGQCKVSGWTDIVAVSAGGFHTAGLKSDGTVVATTYTGDKKYNYGRCDVSGWTDIVAVSARSHHTVGLKSDGTVVAVGSNKYGQCEVSDWTDIVAVSAGGYHTVGLKSDGTVVATTYTGYKEYNYGQCDVSGWTDIVAVSAGWYHTVGLKSDGTVVAVGGNSFGECKVSGWSDIRLPNT